MTPGPKLGRDLAQAKDAQIARIVELIDSLESRGEADNLIAPLRPRLKQLNAARKPRFGRLLFQPFDCVIIEPIYWRPGSALLPRSALRPMIDVVRSGMGAAAGEFDVAIAAGLEPLDRIGSRLWPDAGRVLKRAAEAPVPAGWVASGLPGQIFPGLARAIGGVLPHAARLREMARAARLSREEVRAFLGQVSAEAGEAKGLMAAVMIATLAGCPWLIPLLGEQLGFAVKEAIDSVLERGRAEARMIEASGLPARDAAAKMSQLADLLLSLSVSAGPRRGERVAVIAQEMVAAAQRRLEAGLEAELVGPARALPEQPLAEEITGLEQRARELRCLDAEARRLGGAAANERLLRNAIDAIKRSGLRGADLIRIVEILAGPEEALALLRKG